jgi:hypothetical protein
MVNDAMAGDGVARCVLLGLDGAYTGGMRPDRQRDPRQGRDAVEWNLYQYGQGRRRPVRCSLREAPAVLVRCLLIAATVVLLSGCTQPGDKVRRTSRLGGGDSFVTRCKREAACIADAKATCPEGFVKTGIKDDISIREMTFECHGKANWP